MASEMTKEEWEEKDRRIVKQCALKAAVDFFSNSNDVIGADDVLDVADKFVAWVYNEEVKSPGSNVETDISYPTPTLDQKKALEIVEEETGWNAARVWAKFSKFPVTANVNQCVERIKNES